ncbi:MAG TPA: amino acid transport protein [Candidatus Binatia bacterium]
MPGLTLDPTAMALGFLFGGIGFVAFRYGRKMQRVPPVVLGMVLMTYPLVVSNVAWLTVIGVSLTGGLWLWRD